MENGSKPVVVDVGLGAPAVDLSLGKQKVSPPPQAPSLVSTVWQPGFHPPSSPPPPLEKPLPLVAQVGGTVAAARDSGHHAHPTKLGATRSQYIPPPPLETLPQQSPPLSTPLVPEGKPATVVSAEPVVPLAVTPPPVTPPPVTPPPPATEVAASLLTFERAYAIFEPSAPPGAITATPEAKKKAMEPMVKSCVGAGEQVIALIGTFNKTLGEVEPSIANSMRQEFRSMMKELKEPLPPIYDLDFTKPDVARQKIKESVKGTLPTWEMFAKNSGIDPLDPSVKQAKADFESLCDKIVELRFRQYAIGATEGMDIEAKGANADKEWEARINRLRDDKYYAEIAALGIASGDYAKELHRMHSKLGPDAYLKQLGAETKEVIQGQLYSKIDSSGKEVFVVKSVNERTIQTVIEAKKGQKQIDWSNASRKDMSRIENQCLANWKKVSFDGNETALSKLMPPRKGDWSGWVNNIRGQTSLKRGRLMEQLVRDVVGEDPKRLKEFMQDLRNTSEENRAYAIGHLIPAQRNILQQEYIEQLNKLKKEKEDLKLIQPPLMPEELKTREAKCDAEIANVNKELEVLAEVDPKMAGVLAVAAQMAPESKINEHYITRLVSLETKLENAKKLLEPEAKPSQKVKDAKAVMEDALVVVKKLAPALPVQVQPPPSKELREYLEVREAVEKAKTGPGNDAEYIAGLMAQVTTLANRVVLPAEQVAVKALVEADKKLLQAEEESKKEAIDDVAKLTAELGVARKGFLKIAEANPELLQKFWAAHVPEAGANPQAAKLQAEKLVAVCKSLTPGQQEILQDSYVAQLTELTEELEAANKDVTGKANLAPARIDEELAVLPPQPQPDSPLNLYVAKQKELIAKQKELADAEEALREAEDALALAKQNDESPAKIKEREVEKDRLKESVRVIGVAIIGLKKDVAAEKAKVKDPKEISVVAKVEKIVEDFFSAGEKRKNIAGKLATAAREFGKFIGVTMPPETQSAATDVLTRASKAGAKSDMVIKWALDVFSALKSPAEAKAVQERAEKMKTVAPEKAPGAKLAPGT